MRTRSQPLSPASQVSLDGPRQTRSMRARSVSQTSPHPETATTTTEESTAQPATTNKTTGTKKATTKRATTTKRSAATRRATTARKADTITKTSSKPTKAPANTALKTMAERQSNKRAAGKSAEEDPQESTDASESAGAEADAMPAEFSDIPDGANEEGQKTTEAVSSTTEVLSEPKDNDLNRKRGRVDSSPEAQETPSVKRRALRPPGTTSLARRLFPLSRRLSTTNVSYTERLRRRAAERKGRIHTTVFRLPELVAQTEADRLAEEAEPSSPCPPAPESAIDFSDLHSSRDPDQPSTPQEPQTPGTPRGWNIRGLINSVPRSFSRFLPRLGRSPDKTQEPAHQADPSTTSRPSSSESPSASSATTPRSSGEGASDKSIPVVGNTKKPDLSYSLFPRPIDRSLYLPPASKEANDLKENQAQEQQKEPQVQGQATSEHAPTPVEERASRETVNTQERKKRKRSPSPDVIPNPPGCSYGLDLDYFCYSSDSDEEEPESETPRAEPVSKPTPLSKSAVRSAQHPSKKVRFDSSPEGTPSKIRGRATDPYQGQHFLGLGDSPPTSEKAAPESTPSVPRSPGFIPNTQGTFGFDYDDLSDDSTSSGPPSPGSVLSPEVPTTARTQVQESTHTPGPRPTPRKAFQGPPNTPATTKIDSEALAKVRSQAEKYKPKTPSGLRTASRYSSSPMVLSPDVSPTKPESQNVFKQPHAAKENVPAQPSMPEEQEAEKFGDDKFARDAEWLYENCPSGDLSQLTWPAKRSLVDSLGIDPAVEKLVNTARAEMDTGYRAFRRGMEEFAVTLA